MFNDSINFLVESIEKSPLVNLDGIFYQEYDNFFDEDTIKMLSFTKDSVSLNKFALQENRARLVVSHREKIHKHMTVMFRHKKIREALGKKFNKNLKNSSVDIWYDGPRYTLEPHTDFHTIQLSLQIYLGDPPNPGTSLYKEGTVIKTFDYKKNSGYSLLNNEFSFHGVEGDIVENNLRKSIYVRFDKL
jgi:hypothetical protein